MKTFHILTLAICTLGFALPSDALAGGKNKAGKATKAAADPAKAERREKRKLAHEYDKNENGQIDGAEIEALRKDFDANKTGALKSVDANNDGKLDDSEIGALKHHVKGAGKAGKGGKKKGV